jgi:hypothetical protein
VPGSFNELHKDQIDDAPVKAAFEVLNMCENCMNLYWIQKKPLQIIGDADPSKDGKLTNLCALGGAFRK